MASSNKTSPTSRLPNDSLPHLAKDFLKCRKAPKNYHKTRPAQVRGQASNRIITPKNPVSRGKITPGRLPALWSTRIAPLFSRPRLLRHQVTIRYGFGRDVRNDHLEAWPPPAK
jgi:hypothetical protein